MKLPLELIEMEQSLRAAMSSGDDLNSMLKELFSDPDFKEQNALLVQVAKLEGELLSPTPVALSVWANEPVSRVGFVSKDSVIFRSTKSEGKSLIVDGLKTYLSDDPGFTEYGCVDKTQNYEISKLKNFKGKEIRSSFPFLLLASEMCGVMKAAISMTVDYAKTRVQFGVPIGSFQAVAHPLADSHVKVEGLSSLTQFSAWAFDNSPSQSDLTAFSAWKFAETHGSLTVERAIQLHGGVGFTYEYPLHRYLRRAKVLEVLGGDQSSNLLESI